MSDPLRLFCLRFGSLEDVCDVLRLSADYIPYRTEYCASAKAVDDRSVGKSMFPVFK